MIAAIADIAVIAVIGRIFPLQFLSSSFSDPGLKSFRSG